MNRYYVDWSYSSSGEFIVEAPSTYEAERLLAEIIENELAMEIRNAEDADVSLELDTDPDVDDPALPYYRADKHGIAERFNRRPGHNR